MCKCQPQFFSRCKHLQLNIEPCARSKDGTELCFIPVEEAECDPITKDFLKTDDYCNSCTKKNRNALRDGVSQPDMGAGEPSNPSGRSSLAKLCGYEWIGETRVRDIAGVEEVTKSFLICGQTVTCKWYNGGRFPQAIKMVSEAPEPKQQS